MSTYRPHNDDDTQVRGARIWGVLATIAFHVLLILALVWSVLTFVPGQDEDRRWPPVKDEELLYGGEYVMVGEPVSSPEPDMTSADDGSSESIEAPVPEGADSEDAGEALAQDAPPVTQADPSPVKEISVPEPKPSGPTKEELEEQARIKRQQEASQRISQRVNFGSSSGKTDAKGGSPQGNAASGASSGAPGTDLKGRTLASWSKPAGSATGTITVAVSVDRKGRVTQARYASGSGAVAASAAARRSCEQAALKSSFSVSEDAPAIQKGTITYRFE